MTKHLSRYDLEQDKHGYKIKDRNLPIHERVVATTPDIKVAELIVETLNARA